MNVRLTTFTNPFSFFCIPDVQGKDMSLFENAVDVESSQVLSRKSAISDMDHGQYIAVMWNNKWTRGIVTMETQFLIWLVDYGIFLRPNDKTIYTNLPPEYKKIPTKVFEASVHGITPIDKILSEECQIKNKVTTSWNKGAIERVQDLIKSSVRTNFLPMALLSTKHNDVVLGNLYFKIPSKGLVNLVDELEMWPIFLQKDPDVYLENLSKYYTTHRRHHASNLKPDLLYPSIATITLQTNIQQYKKIVSMCPPIETLLKSTCSEDGSTVTAIETNYKKDKSAYKLTASEIEMFSNKYITVNNHEYNVLNVLLNKIRDLKMCEQYKNRKSVGCGVTCRRLSNL